ncbi:MAG TPA: histidine phosphatase family protein [Rhodospirillaceae bacterium]|nr:MAG: hypothetical protein A2018_08220 [Alphaproteobacteria bacterium GWF2_58_20]HAU29943.1 histidine phosphatase family protein [Rhodospirillaceae bacterium]
MGKRPVPELLVHGIRHGESRANAGGALDNEADIPLTDHGHNQAGAISRIITARPMDLIAVSPYLRAQQTAAPTIAALPNIPHETWPLIREFSFLGQDGLKALRPERLEIAQSYWDRADPVFAAEGAEPFSRLMAHATQIKTKLEALHAEHMARICLFSHAYFLNALRWVMENPSEKPTPYAMRDFMTQYKERPIRNADILTFRHDGTGWKTKN